MRRLDRADLPEMPLEQAVRDVYQVPRPRPTGRPWVGVCMVTSLDGSTVLERSSGGLSSEADQLVLATLRAAADVVLVGASTVRAERYGAPRRAGLRIGVVSRHGTGIDLTGPLFTSGAGFLVMPEDGPALPVDTVRAGRGDVDLAAVLSRLDAGFVHVEGGPTLNGALVAGDLVDELNLTVSPMLVGGDGARIATGAPPQARHMRLAHVLEHDGFVFTRWVRAPG